MSNGAQPQVCVLKADGTNCEIETAYAFTLAGAVASVVPVNRFRWREDSLSNYDVLVVAGGFSYGDDVISGKVLAVELMSFLADQIGEFAAARKPVLGICNGFQVLVRTGLLPFGELGEMQATLAENLSGRFECRWVRMRPEPEVAVAVDLPECVHLPVAHQEGRFLADEATIARIEKQGLVALRYADEECEPTMDYPDNPNGSQVAIAGLTDPHGRVLGLMPHPERYVLREHHPNWRRRPADEMPHGLALIRRIVDLA